MSSITFVKSRNIGRAVKSVIGYLCFVLFTLIVLPASIIFFYPSQHETLDSVAAAEETPAVPLPNSDAEAPTSPPPISHSILIDTITLYRTATGSTEELDFEKYVKGVVASEMPAHFETEALKAQAVAARTYSLSRVIRAGGAGNPNHPQAALCDSTHCQVYRNEEELQAINGGEWMKTGWPRISSAVSATSGQLMYYDGELVAQAMFHSTSGGKTENSEDVFVSAVPYLRSVDSPLEGESPHKSRYGHGVGMSQWGANGMAEAGEDYKKILSHYYTGIEIK